MFRLLESKFRVDNLLLLDLEIFVEVVQLIIESDEGSSFFVELVFCSLIVVLTVRICAPSSKERDLPAVYASSLQGQPARTWSCHERR